MKKTPEGAERGAMIAGTRGSATIPVLRTIGTAGRTRRLPR